MFVAAPIFPFKARDFCTLVHFRFLRDGTIVVLNKATEHTQAPRSAKYVRGAIMLAANIIEPIKGQPNKCKLTMLTQLDPGGFFPAAIVNNVCTAGPVSFFQKLNEVAPKKPSRQIVAQKKAIAAQKKQKVDASTASHNV